MAERADAVDFDVVVVGSGPTGMMLAGELALAGIRVVLIERRPNQELDGARALGLLARTIELLDQRGIADRFLSEGFTTQNAGFGWIPLDFGDFPSRHPYTLALAQQHTERLLAGWIDELGVQIQYGREVTGCSQDEAGVTVTLADGESIRAQYVVGCDGGRSVVRKTAGIGFPGSAASVSYILAIVELSEEPEWGMHRDKRGINSFGKLGEGRSVRLMVTETQPGRDDQPTLPDLSEALVAVYGTDYGVHNPTSISRFTDMARQADTYRKGRVLVAGDAAHVHSPTGGQGLSLGVQDAANLGWKLAQVVKGASSDSLLDTYQAERHPVGAEVVRNSLAQSALLRTDPQSEALRDTVADLLGMDGPRKRIAGMMTGLAIHYDFGEGHPLLGRRVPDLDLITEDGPGRVFSLLHAARPVLLNLGMPEDLDITLWADRVVKVDATNDGIWELPVIGDVAAPTAVLIRPDGYVAWVGEGTDAGLQEALETWFGAA